MSPIWDQTCQNSNIANVRCMRTILVFWLASFLHLRKRFVEILKYHSSASEERKSRHQVRIKSKGVHGHHHQLQKRKSKRGLNHVGWSVKKGGGAERSRLELESDCFHCERELISGWEKGCRQLCHHHHHHHGHHHGHHHHHHHGLGENIGCITVGGVAWFSAT